MYMIKPFTGELCDFHDSTVITWHSVSMYHIAFFFFPDLFEHLSKQQISEVKLLPEGQKADAVYDGITL